MALKNAIGFVRRIITATDKFVGTLVGTLEGSVTFPEYDVVGIPAVEDNTGKVVYVSDGNAGSPCLARSDGTDWISMATGDAITSI